MEEIGKRLVEVEIILRKLDEQYINKIPQEIWEYIEKNKDNQYEFYYNENKTLIEQNFCIDTVSILTYINIEYLLESEQKKEILEILKKDELINEIEKCKNDNLNELFKKRKESKNEQLSLVEVKKDRWYEKIFEFIKKMFRKYGD